MKGRPFYNIMKAVSENIIGLIVQNLDEQIAKKTVKYTRLAKEINDLRAKKMALLSSKDYNKLPTD